MKGLAKKLRTRSDVLKKIKPIIIPRSEHTISRKAIHPNALKVLYRLHEANFNAYLVGGCVRDLLLGRHPKDFDIATNAHPEEVRRLFKNCRLIGKRFRLAHILFGRDIIEVATFRTHHQNAEEKHGRTHEGMIIRDNVYGTLEDDVWRRDFSINSLYYNIADFSIVDFTQGLTDIKTRTLRIIGNPNQRFQEDPVRLLRAARFMGKLSLSLHPETEEPLKSLSHLLENVSPARLYQEVLKMFEEGALFDTFNLLQKFNFLEKLFRQTAKLLHQEKTMRLVSQALQETDFRLRAKKTVSPAFLFAVFLWHPTQEQVKQEEEAGFPPYVAYERALQIVLKIQTEQLALPRQLQTSIREICFLQHSFTHRHSHRSLKTLEHPRFRAGYDLLMLRAKIGEPVQELYLWWTEFHQAPPTHRVEMLKKSKKSSINKRKRHPKTRK